MTPTPSTQTNSSMRAVEFAQTRARAGALLEQGAAFAHLRADPARVLPGDAAAGAAATAQAAERQHYDVVVIGAGQAGLTIGHHLAKAGAKFIILEARERIGDNWRCRWDSLRLFTPARYDGLEGMPFPAKPDVFPTKDEMADFLEAYVDRFQLPVRTGVKVDVLTRRDGHYEVKAGETRYLADQVVVAAASYQTPKIPGFAADLDASIRQLHSSAYRRPSQLRPGKVLLVGAGNSGAELAIDLCRTHEVWLAGRHPGHLPVPHDSALAHRVVIPLVLRLLLHRVLTAASPIGRKARPHFLKHGGPLIRVRPKAMERGGVHRVPRVSSVIEGKPVLQDGRVLDVDNVVWCTGLAPGLDWIKLPIFDADGRPEQHRGVVTDETGLYFAGLAFQHSPSSTMIHGVARDARRVARAIAERSARAQRDRVAAGFRSPSTP